MIEFRSNKVFLCGDTHGISPFFRMLDEIDNSSDIVHIGDLGVGFHHPDEDMEWLKLLDQRLGNKHCKAYVVRGNHDKPSWWPFEFKNLFLVDDYKSGIFPNGKTSLFVGGEISIDRCIRRNDIDYWKGEATKPIPENLGEFGFVFAHGCPSYFNHGTESLKMNWAWVLKQDPALYYLCLDQRAVLDRVAELAKPTHWIYGHFHNDKKENRNGIKARCLNICKIVSFDTDSLKIEDEN